MEKFIVSARKYRPQTFDTVVGQAHITTTLKNAIKNQQLAHAFLFCGPRGVGKTTCARILAKTINCVNQTPDGEACNTCNSCISFNEGTSMNIHELDAASNNSVDDIRTLVEQVRFAPQAGKYKVYIIDEVHMLSSSAFNAFLKTLEEPPPFAIFILATTEKHKIIPTILSRCQIFDFKRITTNDTVEHLQEICEKENINAEKPALQIIAQKSEGCMRDALSIMDKIVSFTNGEVNYKNTLEHLNILDDDYYFKMINCMQQQDLAGAMLLYDDINRKGFEGDLVLNGFAEFIRNLLVCKDDKVANLLEVVENFKERYISTGKKISAAYLISALNVLNETEINYKSARNKRLHVELALIKLTYLQQALDISSVNESAVKKKIIETVKPVAFRNISVIHVPNTLSPIKSSAHEKNNRLKSAETSTPLEQDEAKLIIQTSREKELVTTEENNNEYNKVFNSGPSQEPILPKFGKLQNIRDKFTNKAIDSEQAIISLSMEKLREAWKIFTEQLKEKKNPAAQSFEMAELEIINEGRFDIITNNNLEQRFIEHEKRKLCEYLQQYFRNKGLTLTIKVRENQESYKPDDKHLNKREQYQKIIEQYPLVKELKDRLRMELDY
jgi:DNA polymerase III subunit gamma/tau